MTWSQKRQTLILGSIISLFAIWAAFIIVPKLRVIPTCFDTIQNQNEAGIDCGGACEKYCNFEIKKIVVRWAKAMPVAGNFYNSVAYIENQNPNAGIKKIGYVFKFYDQDNILITERAGSTYISQGGASAIFESSIDMKGLVPKRTDFNFTEEQVFYKQNPALSRIFIAPTDKVLSDVDSKPKLSVDLLNQSSVDLRDVDIIALLYNKELNVVAFSKTNVQDFLKNQKNTVYFTWPNKFSDEVVNIEIISRFNSFVFK